MILYNKSWGGIFLIFRITGTSWPAGLLPGLFSCGISVALSYWGDLDEKVRNRHDEFISHPYPFQLFAYLLGVLMVFRTNFAYNRYWEAISMVQAMGAKWLDGCCMAISFDAPGKNDKPLLHGASEEASLNTDGSGKGGCTHSEFVKDITHICSLLHAVALQHLRDDPDLDNLLATDFNHARSMENWVNGNDELKPSPPSPSASGNGLSKPTSKNPLYPTFSKETLRELNAQQRLHVLGGLKAEERSVLETDAGGVALTTETRVAMVEGWYMRRLIARQKFEEGGSAFTSPPILSRLYQVISDGSLWFAHASKIAITPFPFPYHNLISIFLWAFTLLVPVLVNGTIMDIGMRAVVSFVAVFSYHTLAVVGDNLEDPYLPYDPNELPLCDLQDSLNMRLVAFGIVPGK